MLVFMKRDPDVAVSSWAEIAKAASSNISRPWSAARQWPKFS